MGQLDVCCWCCFWSWCAWHCGWRLQFCHHHHTIIVTINIIIIITTATATITIIIITTITTTTIIIFIINITMIFIIVVIIVTTTTITIIIIIITTIVIIIIIIIIIITIVITITMSHSSLKNQHQIGGGGGEGESIGTVSRPLNELQSGTTGALAGHNRAFQQILTRIVVLSLIVPHPNLYAFHPFPGFMAVLREVTSAWTCTCKNLWASLPCVCWLKTWELQQTPAFILHLPQLDMTPRALPSGLWTTSAGMYGIDWPGSGLGNL